MKTEDTQKMPIARVTFFVILMSGFKLKKVLF